MDKQQSEREDSAMSSERPPLRQLPELDEGTVEEGRTNIRGWHVVDREEERIGSIHALLAPAEIGPAAFAEVSYGGVLGIGAHRTLIPMEDLRVDTENRRVIYQGSADAVRNAPQYSEDVADFDPFYDYWDRLHRAPERELVAGRKGGEMPPPEERVEPRPETEVGRKGGEEHPAIEEARPGPERPAEAGREHHAEERIDTSRKQSIEELTGGEMVAGRKHGEAPVARSRRPGIETERPRRERPGYASEGHIQVDRKQSIEELTGGRISKKS